MVSNDDINNFTFKEYRVSDDLLFANPENMLSVAFPSSYVMVKSSRSDIYKPDPVDIRVSYEVQVWYTAGHSNIFVDGIAVGTVRNPPADSNYHKYTEDISVSLGSVVDIRCIGNSSRFDVKNLNIYGILIDTYIDLFDIIE